MLASLSVPNQGVRLQKDVVVIGAPLILVTHVSKFRHIFRRTWKLSNTQASGNIGVVFLSFYYSKSIPKGLQHIPFTPTTCWHHLYLCKVHHSIGNNSYGRQGTNNKGRFTCSPKSQHRDKVPTFEPQETLKYGLFSLKLDSDYFVQKNSWDLCQELGMASCSIQLSTQVQTSPHTWDFGTRVKWQVQLQCSQWLRLHILTTRDPCEPILRVFILQHKYTNGSNHDNVPWVKATWEARYIS